MAIHRLLYRSDMALPGTAADTRRQVTAVVEQSAARNAAVGLTGALLHTRGVFIQALEGPLPALEATFERICCDLRHRRVALLEFVQADERVFGAWSMARVTTEGTIEQLFTTADLFAERTLDAGSAQATVNLMRALLMTGAGSQQPASPPEVVGSRTAP